MVFVKFEKFGNNCEINVLIKVFFVVVVLIVFILKVGIVLELFLVE